MHGHGAVGRTFAGRIVQLITGSTGLDDWEWGVTLFGVHPDDLKDVRLQDALRRGLGPLRRVRPVLHRHGRPRSRTVLDQRRPADAVTARRGPAATLDALRAELERHRADGGGLQRRGRLGLPGLGGHRHPRSGPGAAASPPSRRRWPPRSSPTAGPWPRSGACAGAEVATDELADPAYAANDGDRCYHCKATLLEALGPLAAAASGGPAPSVVLGVNLDDLGRPPARASRPRPSAGARFPLVEAGFTKADVRAWSRRLGLRTWDKPAAACLASRVPYGTPVTLGTLRSVADAESALRALGFRQLRVRHYGDTGPDRARRRRLPRRSHRRRRDRRRGARRRLPVRDPRPRGVPVGQPQRRRCDRALAGSPARDATSDDRASG